MWFIVEILLDGCFCFLLCFFGFFWWLVLLIFGINGCVGELRVLFGDSLIGRNMLFLFFVVCICFCVFFGFFFGDDNGFKDVLVFGIFLYVLYICFDLEFGVEFVFERKLVYEGGFEYGGGFWE